MGNIPLLAPRRQWFHVDLTTSLIPLVPPGTNGTDVVSQSSEKYLRIKGKYFLYLIFKLSNKCITFQFKIRDLDMRRHEKQGDSDVVWM